MKQNRFEFCSLINIHKSAELVLFKTKGQSFFYKKKRKWSSWIPNRSKTVHLISKWYVRLQFDLTARPSHFFFLFSLCSVSVCLARLSSSHAKKLFFDGDKISKVIEIRLYLPVLYFPVMFAFVMIKKSLRGVVVVFCYSCK